MSERQKETEFLKRLISFADRRLYGDLPDRIHRAEHDERCLRSALALVGLVALLSLSGLCYTAVLLPDLVEPVPSLTVKAFCAFGLASLICLLGFLGQWFWYRGLANRLNAECRRAVMELMARQKTTTTASITVPEVVQLFETADTFKEETCAECALRKAQ